MPLRPCTRLGPYEIAALIGVGGMGEVYRAHDVRLDRDVALKVLAGRNLDTATASFDSNETRAPSPPFRILES